MIKERDDSMATNLEFIANQKQNLNMLLKVKKISLERKWDFPELQEMIRDAVTIMQAEDVAYVEKIIGVKAL